MDFSFSEEQELLAGRRRESSSASGSPPSGSPSWPTRRRAGTRRRGRSSPGSAGRACRSPRKRAARVSASSRRRSSSRSSAGRCTPAPSSRRSRSRCPRSLAELRTEVAAGEATWTVALHGESGLVPDLGIVDRVAVVDEDGIWAVEGESREVLETMDPTRRLGRIGLDGAQRGLSSSRAATPSSCASAIRRRALAALALEAVGIAQRALELSIEHAKTREQFGRPIGVYQAVSHALADTYAETELARSLAYWAAWCVAEQDEQAPLAAPAAKAFAADAAVAACERAIQVHGGVGFTWEHVLHRYYKRAQWIDAFEGFGHEQRAAVARELLDVRAPAAVA